ncbi:unnamed protein product [Clonostachys rosea f. rosea IK726]|uniref:Uncharacterized protein n=1 Tax=Clonostachys rosea f. rosea IK726 TaxID=1349383 RepID=A0ACA9UTX9_BIOOC|nr:unnamed protein product [Clonostachys rosea f. rosea IK726]
MLRTLTYSFDSADIVDQDLTSTHFLHRQSRSLYFYNCENGNFKQTRNATLEEGVSHLSDTAN